MKKSILISTLSAILLLFSACAPKKVTVPDSYTALLYENFAGGAQDNVNECYTGESFDKIERYEKSNKAKLNVSVLGKDHSVSYDFTEKTSEMSYELDRYTYVKDRDFVLVEYKSGTDTVMRYETDEANDRSYSSPVTPDSTEEEYLAYAKQVFLDLAGVSTDGWEVRVETFRAEYGHSDSFINYSSDVPEYNAEYTFTFFKKIGELERGDKMHIRMTNVGKIISFDAVNCDEAFKPFVELEISREKIENAAWESFGRISSVYGYIKSKEIDGIELITKDGCLWAQVTIVYHFEQTSGGVMYAIKLAELK